MGLILTVVKSEFCNRPDLTYLGDDRADEPGEPHHVFDVSGLPPKYSDVCADDGVIIATNPNDEWDWVVISGDCCGNFSYSGGDLRDHPLSAKRLY